MAWDVWEKGKWRFLMIGTVLALTGCGKDEDVVTVTKDMKICRDGGGKPLLATDVFSRGLHVVCWPQENFK